MNITIRKVSYVTHMHIALTTGSSTMQRNIWPQENQSHHNKSKMNFILVYVNASVFVFFSVFLKSMGSESIKTLLMQITRQKFGSHEILNHLFLYKSHAKFSENYSSWGRFCSSNFHWKCPFDRFPGHKISSAKKRLKTPDIDRMFTCMSLFSELRLNKIMKQKLSNHSAIFMSSIIKFATNVNT